MRKTGNIPGERYAWIKFTIYDKEKQEMGLFVYRILIHAYRSPGILPVFLRIIRTLCNFPITQEREDLKTTTYNNLKPDTILKNFWKNNEHFADLFNAALFNGSQVIKPEDLSEADTDVSSLLKFNNHTETIQRIWDVVKKTAYGVDFVIWF